MTRNTICKSVAIISSHPSLNYIKSKLGVVTESIFNQRDLADLDILKKLYHSLNEHYAEAPIELLFNNGIQVTGFVTFFKKNFLKLFKLFFLEKKILFFGRNFEVFSHCQYAIMSLFPGAAKALYDSLSFEYSDDNDNGDDCTSQDDRKPKEDYCDEYGLPLRLFHKTSIFQPYLPLQNISSTLMESYSFIIGTSNRLILEEGASLIDVIVNFDDGEISIVNKQLNPLLELTPSDRKFADVITDKAVSECPSESLEDTIDNYTYYGSDEYIRNSFGEYVTRLLSLIYRQYSENTDDLQFENDFFNLSEFNSQWVEAWKKTWNHRIWYENVMMLSRRKNVNPFENIKPQHVTFSPSLVTSTQHTFQYKWYSLRKNIKEFTDMLDSSIQKLKTPDKGGTKKDGQ